MALFALDALLTQETKTRIYEKGLALAKGLGLTVTSWQTGDPTRSLYHYLAEILSTLEGVIAPYVAAGFLDWAVEKAVETGDTTWLKLHAEQVFGVEAVEATYATTTVTLSNGGGGVYDIEPGDLTFKNTASGKTYHNTSGGTLASGPGTTLDVDVIADEPGSASSALATEIDDLVTTLLEVTVSNAAAAVGLDEEEPESIAERCRDSLGALSPNGPRDAYNYVAKNSKLTGITTITRTKSVGDSATGDVALYLAGASGAVSGGDVTAVTNAIVEWATPLCITPTPASATNKVIAITYEIWLYSSVGKTSGEVEPDVEAALAKLFRQRPIGGDVIPPAVGRMYHSLILGAIRGVYPNHTFRVAVTTPPADTDLTASEVATLGTVTATAVNFVSDP